MTVHTPEQLAHEQRRYLQVFAWLVVLTAVELGTPSIDALSHQSRSTMWRKRRWVR